jgi:hypothetical protein
MKHATLIASVVCVGLFCASCIWSPETSFFSKFSVRQLVERSKPSAGLNCEPSEGGGGGTGGGFGSFGSGRSRFKAHKSDSWGCRLKSNEAFDESALFAGLKMDVERLLHESGAQITDRGSSGATSFYFVYALKNVRGRVQVSGTRIGSGYYNVHADLDESDN